MKFSYLINYYQKFRRTKLDEVQILRAAGIYGLLNLFYLYCGFLISKLLKFPIQFGYPFAINLEPTTSCNLRCPECISGLRAFTRPKGMLSLSDSQSIFSKLPRSTFYANLYFQGEPYLNPNFFEFVALAKQRNLYVSTSTNAHYLDIENAQKTISSGLNRLIISLDGTTQDTYEAYRIGGDISTVFAGITNLVKAKNEAKSNTPYLILQFLVVQPNEFQINDAKLIADKLGVDEIRFKTAQIDNYEFGNHLIPKNSKYSRYKQNLNGTYSLKHSLENKCWRMWSSSVITWDGNMVPCCFDKDAKHKMGNLLSSNFRQIWFSEGYSSFRKQIFTNRNTIDMCKNCTEGASVFET